VSKFFGGGKDRRLQGMHFQGRKNIYFVQSIFVHPMNKRLTSESMTLEKQFGGNCI
jgi:hypothetical protein